MRRKNNALDRIAIGSDLPGEYMPGVPLVELAGGNRVLIENHLGVCAYGKDNISVNVRFGTISVDGSDLTLVKMDRYQLVITGKICGIRIEK